MKSQNSVILVRGDENIGNLGYFGVLTYIIELSYFGGNNVALFRCDWWDVYSKRRGYKEDKYEFILINSKRKLRTNEPYVFASQAQQVYYVKDTKDPNLLVVVKTKPQDWYDMPEEDINEVCDVDIQAQLQKTHDKKAQVHKMKNEVQDPIQNLGGPMTRGRLRKI